MLNDRDEKYDGQDDSEYHFSDEEVNYEIEEPITASSLEEKSSIWTRLTRSKRMIISLIVFLILVFIVYKMLVPSTVPPPIDLTPAPVTTQQKPLSPPPAAPYPGRTPTTAVVTSTPSAPVATIPPSVPNQQPEVASSSSMTPPESTPVTTMPPTTPTQPPFPAPPSTVASLPPVIPVQSPAPPYPPQTSQTLDNNSMQARWALLSAEHEKLVSQLQAEYTQRISEFATQNKMLQEELRTLGTRVSMIEMQINQLVQTMTRQSVPGEAASFEHSAEPKGSYTVQAIIPGRAWLRADNGETLTVAEGDIIKGMGKVVKVDPYDGVVEINTGNKVISLSYGNGG